MNRFLLLFALPALFFTTSSIAKGHGGGHGGGGHHGGGGGHSGGGGHASGGGFGNHSGASHGSTARTTNGTTGAHTTARTVSGSRTLPGGYTGPVRNHTYIPGHGGTPGYNSAGYNYNGGNNGGAYREHYSSYPYYYYGCQPFLYDPYFGMFSFGMGYMYSPSYSTVPDNYNANNNPNNYPAEQGLDGFVVFEHDTISGAITIKNNKVSLETADTVRGYDYKFKMKNAALSYVTVYNDDDKQLNLVRLKDEPKKLWRIVHQGKLNIYDERRDFIYKPEDIDAHTIMVVYNGEIVPLRSRSMEVTKQRLTAFVNKAYGTDLDPKKYSWKELLVYIDKQD